MKFTVIEMQNGVVGANVWTYTDRNAAESKYHYVLAAAAVSAVENHAAVLLTEDGLALSHASYKHPVEPESPVEAEE